MPITPFLMGEAFDPDAIRTMGTALEKACERLNLSRGASDQITQHLASKIIDLARGGVTDPETLCDHVLHELNGGGENTST